MLRVREGLAGLSLPSRSFGWGRLALALLIGFQLGSCGAGKGATYYHDYYQRLYAPGPAPSPTPPVQVRLAR